MFALFLSGTTALFLFICFGFFITKVSAIGGTFFEKVLIGLIGVNVCTSFISIFTPISCYILICFVIAAIPCTFYIKKELLQIYKTIKTNQYIILFSIPFILVNVSIALHAPSVFDSGLYHIQSIKWIEEYPTVPGLANLHHRFGFNPIAFSLYALTSFKDLFNEEIFSINLLLSSVLIVYFIKRLFTTLKKEGVNNYFIFYGIFFYVLILLNNKISSPSPDYISSVFLLFIFIRIIEIEHSKTDATFKTFIPTILLSTYCILAKLSTLPICLIVVYLMYTYSSNWKQVIRIGIVMIVICLPWLINTVLLTGWLIYPFSALDFFDFDWEVPARIVDQANAEIVGWARSPNDRYYEVSKMSLLTWVPIWWSYLTGSIRVLIIGSVVFPVILFIMQRIKMSPSNRLLDLCMLTSVVGVLFWFFTAPDFRFGHIFILIACSMPVLYINSTFGIFKHGAGMNKNIFFLIVCVLLLLKSIRNDYGHNIQGFFYTFKNQPITPEKIVSTNASYTYMYIGNQKIYKPVLDERCFDHPIPCTHLDVSMIELRGLDLSAGFRYTIKDK